MAETKRSETRPILVILGHPARESYNRALAEAYLEGARSAEREVHLLDLGRLEFDPILRQGYGGSQPLEPDLRHARALIKHCAHQVWIYPGWWASPPALVKGFVERVLTPGFAFEYREDRPTPRPLLEGKSARIIVTSSTPGFYYHLFLLRSPDRVLRRSVLNLCGVRPVRVTHLARVRSVDQAKRESWLEKVRGLGRRGA